MRHKRNWLKELWMNRPWVFFPAVIRYMKDYPLRRKEGGKFRIWLRNCLYINWQES